MSLIKKTTASFAIVALASGLFANGASAYSTADVDAANRLADAGVIVKQSNPADYQLDRNVLRQEIAAVARGIAKIEKKATCSNSFKDVSATKPNEWVCGRVEALVEASYIAKNKNYRPMSNITKIEALGFLANTLFKEQYTEIRDKNVSWEESAVDFFTNKVNFLTKEEIGDYKAEASRWFVFYILAKALKERA